MVCSGVGDTGDRQEQSTITFDSVAKCVCIPQGIRCVNNMLKTLYYKKLELSRKTILCMRYECISESSASLIELLTRYVTASTCLANHLLRLLSASNWRNIMLSTNRK